jgi:hypothetical protein
MSREAGTGIGLLVVVGLLAGCNKNGGEEKYVPAESNAREALTAALTRWKDGESKPAEVAVGKVKVQVLDKAWTDGIKLQSFEIVGEEKPATEPGPRVFSVRMKTSKGEQTAKYYVFGLDPLWVCDEAGYKQMTGS